MLLFAADEIEAKEDLWLVYNSVSHAGGKLSCDALCCGLPISGLVDTWPIVFPSTKV